ncbi:MAG: Txe/YoeB family addiction module toxin [Sphingomicrobium sp.]
MKLVFSSAAWADYVQWQAEDAAITARINLLIGECIRHPFTGTGKPEPLKRNLAGWWSRRINREHRLIYRVAGKGEAQALEVLSCRFHY